MTELRTALHLQVRSRASSSCSTASQKAQRKGVVVSFCRLSFHSDCMGSNVVARRYNLSRRHVIFGQVAETRPQGRQVFWLPAPNCAELILEPEGFVCGEVDSDFRGFVNC